MSLTKLLKSPIKLFKKDVITFVVIRRFDFGIKEETLGYVGVKPSASILVLRQKVWHLLHLPDYCDEVIILKSGDGKELPLTALRSGNSPQHPYILEVFLPGQDVNTSKNASTKRTMLTMGLENAASGDRQIAPGINGTPTCSTIDENMSYLKYSGNIKKLSKTFSLSKKSSLTCKMSSTSFIKLGQKKSSFTSLLIKIQSDLNYLTNKLSNLEHRLPT